MSAEFRRLYSYGKILDFILSAMGFEQRQSSNPIDQGKENTSCQEPESHAHLKPSYSNSSYSSTADTSVHANPSLIVLLTANSER